MANARIEKGSFSSEGVLLASGYALWLAMYPLLTFVLRGSGTLSTTLALLVGMAVFSLHMVLRTRDVPTDPITYTYIGLFSCIILASQLIGNVEGLDGPSIIQSFVMIGVFVVVAVLSVNRNCLEYILRCYAVVVSCVLLLVYLDGDFVWGRLTGYAAPNYWGMMGQSALLAGFALRSRKTRYGVWAVAALILYATNSRGSMVSAAAGVSAIICASVVTGNHGKRIKVIALASLALAFLAWTELTHGFISNQLLQLDDPYRGVESGFTGRFEPWVYGLSLGMERPIFGYGYRQSEALFDPLGVSSVHNGYLSMWLDTGLFGLLLYLVFIGHALWNGVKRWADPFERICLGLVVSYAVYGFFERYALNAGQPLSILFLVASFRLVRNSRASAVQSFATRRYGKIGAVG